MKKRGTSGGGLTSRSTTETPDRLRERIIEGEKMAARLREHANGIDGTLAYLRAHLAQITAVAVAVALVIGAAMPTLLQSPLLPS